MSETANETVVTAPVDAAAPVVEATPVVDEKPDNVGEAIKKEVERREAQLIQKYEQESTKKSQAARDAYVAEQGYEWNGKAITTEAELKRARKESELTEEYKAKELPDDVIQQLLDAQKFREEAEPLISSLKSEKKQTADFKAFYEEYPSIDAKEIPQSVWDEYAAGKDLVESYAKHENKLLKQKLAEFEKQKQIEQQNKENAEAATGSVIGQGTAVIANFTREQVAAMSKEEMKTNYSAVVASMKAWKK